MCDRSVQRTCNISMNISSEEFGEMQTTVGFTCFHKLCPSLLSTSVSSLQERPTIGAVGCLSTNPVTNFTSFNQLKTF